MAIRYFKKLVPQNPVRLSGNIAVKFKTVDDTVGFYASGDDNMSAEFERLIRAGEYGMSEISAEEFSAEYLEKKRGGSKPIGREEFGASGLSQLISQGQQLASQAEAAAVGSAEPVATTAMAAPAPAPVVPPKTEFTPPVGTRKRRSNKSTPIE